MSHQASVAILAGIRAGQLPDGAQGLVLMAMAAEADHKQGHRVAETTRQLPGNQRTVRTALAAGVRAGVLEVVQAARGTRPAVYRVVVPTCGQGDESAVLSTAEKDDDCVVARHHRGTDYRSSAVLSTASLGEVPSNPHLSAVTTPGGDVLALVVGTEMTVARARGPVRDPVSLAGAIRARVTQSHGALLRQVATPDYASAYRTAHGRDLTPRLAAVEVLRADMTAAHCPVPDCGAFDARAITDPGQCSVRARGCPFYVSDIAAGDAGQVERGPSRTRVNVGNDDGHAVPASPAAVAAP